MDTRQCRPMALRLMPTGSDGQMDEKALSMNARLLETILFLENEPMDMERITKMTELSEDDAKAALSELEEHYFKHLHGLQLVMTDDQWQFLPSADLYEGLRKAYGKKVDKRLSKAAMETLSIVAYSQPVTRREIDNIRGVVSDSIMRILRERDYIKVIGRKDVPGHPCLYGTTRKFLYEFGLQSIGDLPKMSEIDKQRFENDEA
ncbi:MAG: SMC-Scp complex subunit ScpB [Sphaerochaetaceae bacterium]